MISLYILKKNSYIWVKISNLFIFIVMNILKVCIYGILYYVCDLYFINKNLIENVSYFSWNIFVIKFLILKINLNENYFFKIIFNKRVL